MTGKKVCCTITLIMLCLLTINFFLPIMSDGEISISFFDIINEFNRVGQADSVFSFMVIFYLIVYFSFLALGIVNCILCLCNVTKDYKYALSSISIPLLVYFVLFASLITGGGKYMSIGAILGIILPVASLVLIFVGNALGNKSNSNNYPNNYVNNLPNTPIKGYDPRTGRPIYATFKGYNPRTGEPIFD